MKYCPKCGNKYDNDLNFCLVDGEPLPKADPEAETLRIKPSDVTVQPVQRITLIQKTEVVGLGDYIQFVTPRFTIQIVVKDLLEVELPSSIFGSQPSKQLVVQILFALVNSKQGIIHGGSRTKQVGFNEYLMPVADPEHDETRSAFFFYANTERTIVFRAYVKHINPHSKKVELNIAYFRCENE